jgi:SRSO17 transposase
MVINARKTKLCHLAAAAPEFGHRTSHARFLLSDWDASGLLAAEAWRIVRAMKPRPGEPIALVIDDTRIAKRGKKMEGVSKIWDQKSHGFIHGHVVIMAAIVFRGVSIPWAIDLWIPKAHAGKSYRKLNHIAAAMIHAFPQSLGLKVRVLFDAAYLAPAVIRACESRGFTWFSVAARNRNLIIGGKKQKLRDIAPGILRYRGRRVRMRRSRGWRWLRIAAVDGTLGRTGEVRVVFSKRSRHSNKELLSVATNDVARTPREIIAIYEQRWKIEVLFKEMRTSLGLCDYQVLSGTAIVRHLHLCCVAHQTLTHQALTDEGAQAKEKNTEVVLPSLTQRIQIFRQRVNQDRIQHLLSRIRDPKLKRKLRQYLTHEAAVAA